MTFSATNNQPTRTPILPGHVYRPRLILPTERHVRLLRLLHAKSRPGNGGHRVSEWDQSTLAERLGISERTLQRLIADLREPGPPDARNRRSGVSATGRRMGLLTVHPTTYTDPTTGQHRRGRNRYVLLVSGDVIAQCLSATPIPALTSHDADPVADLPQEALELLEAVPTPTNLLSHPRAREISLVLHTNNPPSVTTFTWPAPPDVEQPTPAPVLLIRRCSVCGERCQVDQAQHIGCEPSNGTVMRERQLRATLERAFGHDVSIEVNDRRHVSTRHPPDGWAWIWEAKRTGRCVRCSKWAHTNGPDGQAWHPFCWALPDVPVLKDTRPPDWWRRR